ncbi:hypothetical protein Lupro_12160 [Lutibacter profundi]|uniref:Uncharacterized protein n=1 Tax=Lutibacter profundi TaxID=1622118 RepID=A0A0X8G8D5_9FLAO|nr:hypothetical protein [Lutibacter profundi]AMC11968.1 hypothetical protein Lupro_12160 [Lutibacter profundi]
MKKIMIFLLAISMLIPNKAEAQKKGTGVAIAAAGLLAIGAGIAAVKQMQERAELTATQWVLSNRPKLTSFSLKTLDFEGKKLKDMSSVSVILFNIQEFEPQDKPILNGKKQVLFGFTSHGWISEQGINFEKVRWYLIDETEWMNMMTSYVKVASNEKDMNTIKAILRTGKIVNKGVKTRSKLSIPFFKLSGDMYVVTDYSDAMKLIYNEKSLGIFLKETRDLVQIGRSEIIKIHNFFFDD